MQISGLRRRRIEPSRQQIQRRLSFLRRRRPRPGPQQASAAFPFCVGVGRDPALSRSAPPLLLRRRRIGDPSHQRGSATLMISRIDNFSCRIHFDLCTASRRHFSSLQASQQQLTSRPKLKCRFHRSSLDTMVGPALGPHFVALRISRRKGPGKNAVNDY